MIVLDIAAPILLMFGLLDSASSNASLLNNFEIVCTSLIALLIFKEAVSKRMWFAISLITLSSFVLSFENISAFKFSWGAILDLLATLCWGLENNCTKNLLSKNMLGCAKSIFKITLDFRHLFAMGDGDFYGHYQIIMVLQLLPYLMLNKRK